MQNNKITDKTILERKQKLRETADQLKKEFIGLDNVIEEVMDLLTPWFLFPDAQLRPTIINMWGLTGSGKTALVNHIIELLDYKRLYVQMDMGEFESDSASWIKTMFTDELEFFHQQPGVICFDEFQFARTVNKEGNEMGKDKMRVVWDILDTGRINYIPYQNSYYMIRAELCLMNLLKCEDKGVIVRNGVVEGEEKEFLGIFDEYYFENNTRYGKAVDKMYFLSQDFIDGLFFLFNNDDVSRQKIRERLEKSDLADLQRILTEAASRKAAVKQLDLSRSLIFVLGNLDEAYYMSHSLNPDISADELHEATCKINVAHIKSALKERFRNEQIARLGNNHVIYRSFTSENFRNIILQKFEVLKLYVAQRFGFEINFDSSVVDIVYKEGVFPAQGTRPLFTTIKNLIEGNIARVVLEMLSNSLSAECIEWRYADEKFIFVFTNAAGEELHKYEQKLPLKIETLRKAENSSLQAHTAVHEAGHAILAALTLRIIPSLIVSKTVSAHSDGFCMVNMPEGPLTLDVLEKEMIIGLGGYVAEKLVFGIENTCSGVSHDIERVSEMANRAVKEYAMGDDPIYVRFAASQDNLAIVHQQTHTEQALKLIRDCQAKAEEILEKNKFLLLKMAEYLTTHSRMEEQEIKHMVIKYASDAWVREEAFIKKENYFNFAQMIGRQLEEYKLLVD